MHIALYAVAGVFMILTSVFLMLYRAYGRGWNDHAQRRAAAARRSIACRSVSALARDSVGG